MKNIIIIVVSFFILTGAGFSQISTFNSHQAEWGWSGQKKGLYSKEKVVTILQENWGKTNLLNLQEKVDIVTAAEFLWKVDRSLVNQALSSRSSFLTGDQVDSLVVTLKPSGSGEILLYSGENIVGRVRCQSSAHREGEFRQLSEGSHKVVDKDKNHRSRQFSAEMPNAICLDSTRQIWIHNGDLTSESHGCIRVSGPVGRELFKIIPVDIPVRMVWK